MTQNALGLPRNIPADVKREVRRRSKHGCVFCRAMVYQYEHIEPVFANAASHDPNAICLLCPICHMEVTSVRLSKQQVWNDYLQVQNSSDVEPPHYQMRFPEQMRLHLGTSTFDFLPDGFSIVEYDGYSLLGIRYKKISGKPGVYPTLSGQIYDQSGQPVLKIVDNEITLAAAEIDVEAKGRVIRMSGASSNFDLRLTFLPNGVLQIDKLLMRFKEIEIDARDDFGVIGPTLNNRRARCLFGHLNASGCAAALAFNPDRSSWSSDGVSMIGGIGVQLPFMGVTIAKGAGSMTLPKIQCEWV